MAMKDTFGKKYNDKDSLTPRIIHKTLNMIPDKFTVQDLHREMNKRKVLGDIPLAEAVQRVRKLRKLGIIKLKELESREDEEHIIYEKSDLYKYE